MEFKIDTIFFLEILVIVLVSIYFCFYFNYYSAYSGWTEFYTLFSTFIYGSSLVCSLYIVSNNIGVEKKLGYFPMVFSILAFLFYFILYYTRILPIQVFYFRKDITQVFVLLNSFTFVEKRMPEKRSRIQGLFDGITTVMIIGFALFAPFPLLRPT